MRDFSIDSQAEKIYSSKTKEYFSEVIKSYYNESYRSAVVMLYSIAIADLLFKLTELSDIYNDEGAKSILEEIEKLQKNNSNLSEWESKLIDLVKSNTNLFEHADYLNLITLQKHRHLCAHPVMTDHFELYQPNKETTRAHIRNILEGLLIKPALLSRKILDDLLQNLIKIKRLSYTESQIKQHLLDKYFNRLSIKGASKIFRSLWKLVFVLNDPLCQANREINLQALKVLLNKEYADLLKGIKDERDYYSDFDEANIKSMLFFLNDFPSVFEIFNESSRILIKNQVSANADYDTCAIFLSLSIEKHVEKITSISWQSGYVETFIDVDSILIVFEKMLEQNRDTAYSFLIEMFGNSSQFVIADVRYDTLIQPYLNQFTRKELIKIVKAVNSNGQINSRRRARSTNYEIKKYLDNLEAQKQFDFTKYVDFRY